MANNRQDINISEQWANASSNKIVVNEQEASLGITYQGPINSNQLNGLANWITRALSYQQNHSGLYNPLRQYNKGDSCFLLGLDSLNNYNLKMYICKRDADYPIANITPINAALQTLTLQGEVIYYYVILPDEVIVNEPWEEIVVGGDDRKFVYTRAELSYKDKTIEQEYTRTYTDTTGEVTEIVRGDSTTVYADYEQPQSIQASKIFVKGGRFGDLIVPNTQTVILSESTAPNIAVADPMIPNPTLIVKGSGLIDTDATMLVLNSSPDESQQAEYARRQGNMIQSTNQAQATGYTAGPLNSVSGLLATTANPKNFNSPLSKYEGIYISKRLEAGGSNFKICSTNSTYTTGSNSDELVTHKDLSRFVLPYIESEVSDTRLIQEYGALTLYAYCLIKAFPNLSTLPTDLVTVEVPPSLEQAISLRQTLPAVSMRYLNQWDSYDPLNYTYMHSVNRSNYFIAGYSIESGGTYNYVCEGGASHFVNEIRATGGLGINVLVSPGALKGFIKDVSAGTVYIAATISISKADLVELIKLYNNI